MGVKNCRKTVPPDENAVFDRMLVGDFRIKVLRHYVGGRLVKWH